MLMVILMFFFIFNINRSIDDRLFGLTEEQIELRATVQQFCKKEIRPLAEVRRKKYGISNHESCQTEFHS